MCKEKVTILIVMCCVGKLFSHNALLFLFQFLQTFHLFGLKELVDAT